MARNSTLGAAKAAKNDEFYTQRQDIENELSHYEDHFRGKVVYCNCDDPAESEFWKFFQRNFTAWGLKRLIATHYEPNDQNFSYMIEMKPGDPWDKEPEKVPLPCNGDVRSAACIELLKQADIVVTNPPFSLFREYVAQLMEYGKKFVIIGNQNAITYKEFFPLLKENKVWIGYSSNKTMIFRVPDGYKYDSKLTEMINDGYHYGKVPAISWFTNLDIAKRHDPLDLRSNYYDPEKYPRYDNYDAVEVSKVDDIPCDYDGVMGVPITFMAKYCPEQFEIVGISKTWATNFEVDKSRVYSSAHQHNKDGSVSSGSKINDGGAIALRERPVGIYYTDDAEDNAGKYLIQVYARVFIRNKRPIKGAVAV